MQDEPKDAVFQTPDEQEITTRGIRAIYEAGYKSGYQKGHAWGYADGRKWLSSRWEPLFMLAVALGGMGLGQLIYVLLRAWLAPMLGVQHAG